MDAPSTPPRRVPVEISRRQLGKELVATFDAKLEAFFRAESERGRAAASLARHTAAAEAAPVTSAAKTKKPSYFVTGECYHVDEDCYGLRKAKSVEKVKHRDGRRPCKVCCHADKDDAAVLRAAPAKAEPGWLLHVPTFSVPTFSLDYSYSSSLQQLELVCSRVEQSLDD